MGKSNSTLPAAKCDGEHVSAEFEPGTMYCGSDKQDTAIICKNRICKQCTYMLQTETGPRKVCKMCFLVSQQTQARQSTKLVESKITNHNGLNFKYQIKFDQGKISWIEELLAEDVVPLWKKGEEFKVRPKSLLRPEVSKIYTLCPEQPRKMLGQFYLYVQSVEQAKA